jgi:hypothetical protein
MFDVYPSNWPLVDTSDPRNQFHETALHEAQVATDARGFATPAPSHDSLVTRLRLAYAGGPAATEPSSCPA